MNEIKSNNKKRDSLAKDTGLFAVSNFGSKILIFLLTPLYTSVLTTTEYGVADLIMTTINFVYPVLTLAISEATLRFALDKDKDNKSVLFTSMFFISLSVVVLILFSPLIRSVSEEEISEYWRIFVSIYALYNYHNCLSNYAKGIGKTKLFAIQGITMTVSLISTNILFLLVFKMGLFGYLMSIIISYIVPIIVMMIGCKVFLFKRLWEIDKGLLKEMLIYSLPMVPTILAWAVNTSIDKFMIIGMAGLSASGIYSVAHKIPSIFTTVISVFIQAWQISAIENYGDSDEGEYYTIVYAHLDYCNMVGCIIIALLSKLFATVLFSESYYDAWQFIPLLTVSAMFSGLAGFLASAFRAAKKTKSLFYSVMLGAVVNIILNIILISRIGALGAALATTLGFVVTWFVRIILIKKIVDIKINVFKTCFTYFLFITSIIIITLDLQCALSIAVLVLLVISVMYKSEFKNIFFLSFKLIKRLLRR